MTPSDADRPPVDGPGRGAEGHDLGRSSQGAPETSGASSRRGADPPGARDQRQRSEGDDFGGEQAQRHPSDEGARAGSGEPGVPGGDEESLRRRGPAGGATTPRD